MTFDWEAFDKLCEEALARPKWQYDGETVLDCVDNDGNPRPVESERVSKFPRATLLDIEDFWIEPTS